MRPAGIAFPPAQLSRGRLPLNECPAPVCHPNPQRPAPPRSPLRPLFIGCENTEHDEHPPAPACPLPGTAAPGAGAPDPGRLRRRGRRAGAAAPAAPAPLPPGQGPPSAALTLLTTSSAGRHVSFVDPAAGVLGEVEVGAAPWGAALGAGQRVYVATAEGVAVVDTARRERVALVPYRAAVGPPRFGEYRPGGMGIAVAPAGDLLYVGVYLGSAPSRLEVVDLARLEVVGDVQIGLRPFEVLAPPAPSDRREAYALDHDFVQRHRGGRLRSRAAPGAHAPRGAPRSGRLRQAALRRRAARRRAPAAARPGSRPAGARPCLRGLPGPPHARRHPPARRRPLPGRGRSTWSAPAQRGASTAAPA